MRASEQASTPEQIEAAEAEERGEGDWIGSPSLSPGSHHLGVLCYAGLGLGVGEAGVVLFANTAV